MNRTMHLLICLSMLSFAACSKQEPGTPAPAQTTASDDGKDSDRLDHPNSGASTGMSAGHGGPIIELGTARIGDFTVRASRDQGEIRPGGDAPIDVWLTEGDLSKVSAVRFWIGTQDGVESVKAKAEIENPSEPNHWHTHAEVPSPLPADSRLWVEIEVDGQKQVGSFDLRQ